MLRVPGGFQQQACNSFSCNMQQLAHPGHHRRAAGLWSAAVGAELSVAVKISRGHRTPGSLVARWAPHTRLTSAAGEPAPQAVPGSGKPFPTVGFLIKRLLCWHTPWSGPGFNRLRAQRV